jgi:hypothetical protein
MHIDRPGLGALLGAVVGFALSAPVLAETSPYYLGGVASLTHLTNVLALPDGVDQIPTGYSSKSDEVLTLALIAGVDQTIGRQRVFGDATLRNNRYRKNDLLDNNSYALNAGVDWQTIERLSGRISAQATQDLVRFTTTERPSGTQNQVQTRRADASARYGLVSAWTAEGSTSYRSIHYSDPHSDPSDYKETAFNIGTRYWSKGVNWVGLTLRNVNGRYPNFPGGEDTLDRKDFELSAYYRFSEASSVDARLAHTDLEYQKQQRLNFSGLTGRIAGTWTPTVKTSLRTELARDRGSDLFLQADQFGVSRLTSSQLATYLRVRGDYQATAKVAFNAEARWIKQDIAVVVPGTDLTLESGQEKTQVLSLGASWTPTRTSVFSCNLSQDRRRSDIAQAVLNITSAAIGCSAQLTVQP